MKFIYDQNQSGDLIRTLIRRKFSTVFMNHLSRIRRLWCTKKMCCKWNHFSTLKKLIFDQYQYFSETRFKLGQFSRRGIWVKRISSLKNKCSVFFIEIWLKVFHNSAENWRRKCYNTYFPSIEEVMQSWDWEPFFHLQNVFLIISWIFSELA